MSEQTQQPTQQPAEAGTVQGSTLGDIGKTQNPQNLPQHVLNDLATMDTGEQATQTQQQSESLESSTSDLKDSNTSSENDGSASEIKSGDAAIDAGIKILQKVSGLTQQDVVRAVKLAVEHGDVSMIDTAFINERFGEHAEYATTLAQAYVQKNIEESKSIVQKVYDLAGSEEQWGQANDIFKANAPQSLQRAAKACVDTGDFQGYAELVLDYVKSNGLVPTHGKQLIGTQGSGGALSRDAFNKELLALKNEAGNRSLESPQYVERYNALIKRRALGKSQGL